MNRQNPHCCVAVVEGALLKRLRHEIERKEQSEEFTVKFHVQRSKTFRDHGE